MPLANFDVIVLAECAGPNGQRPRKSERKGRKTTFVAAAADERPFRRPAESVAIDADAGGIFSRRFVGPAGAPEADRSADQSRRRPPENRKFHTERSSDDERRRRVRQQRRRGRAAAADRAQPSTATRKLH